MRRHSYGFDDGGPSLGCCGVEGSLGKDAVRGSRPRTRLPGVGAVGEKARVDVKVALPCSDEERRLPGVGAAVLGGGRSVVGVGPFGEQLAHARGVAVEAAREEQAGAHGGHCV
jgi:hypothetical protein